MSAIGILVAKVMRFGLVGAMNSLIYAVVTALCVRNLSVNSTLSSVIGYVAVLPLAFAAHKWFTFRAVGDARAEMFRFAIVYISGLAISVLAMYLATDILGLSYLFGIAGAVLLVPLLTLFVLDRWVFTNQVIS